MKTVNVLTAIRRIKTAWDAVQPQTIINCFRKTGALPQDEETESEEDPFADIEEEDMSSLDELVCQINPDASTSDYIDADEDLSTSLTLRTHLIGGKNYEHWLVRKDNQHPRELEMKKVMTMKMRSSQK